MSNTPRGYDLNLVDETGCPSGGRDYLGRVLQVLDVVAASGRPVSMSEICRRVALPMTTVHRLLTTLRQAGVVERDLKRRYVMGDRLAKLGRGGDAA